MQEDLWNWLTDKDINCLKKMREASEEEVVVFSRKSYHSNIRVKAAINPKFKLNKDNMIVLVSYNDVKRIFKSLISFADYLKHNFYRRNTKKGFGINKVEKKRTRLFIVPINASSYCLRALDKIIEARLNIEDLNELNVRIHNLQVKGSSVENKIRKTLKVKTHKHIDSNIGSRGS